MNGGKNKVKEPVSIYGEDYTYGDYLDFKFDYMVELIRGKIFKMSPAPSLTHQQVLGNLYILLGPYFKPKPLCNVFIAPFDVVLPIPNKRTINKARTVVQPDLCVVCDQSKLNEAGCFGAPDFIIEILSPHTSKKDLQLKYDIYEEVGVSEYWVVMPFDQLVEVFTLMNGKYQRIGMYTKEDQISPSQFPELKIDLSEVFPK